MMKRMPLLILLGLIASNEPFAQSCAPIGISTGMPNPVNPDPTGRLNTFDYTATGWPLRTEYLPNDTWKQSPFYSDNNAAIQHFYAPNDGIKDILPSNGWELIKRDFGYEDDGSPSPEKAKNPFLVLYNRYTGVLRIFVARYSQQNFNGANIKIRFTPDSPMQTSLLDLSSGVKAIDATFVPDPSLISIVNFPSGPYEWFYSDFQMVYDPCTCLFTSKLQIELSLSSSSTISLTGSSSGTIISDGAPTSSQSDKGPISFGDVASGIKKGAQGYKDGVKAQNDILEAIDKRGGSQQSTRTTGLNNLSNALKTNTFLKAGLNSIPFVSAALSVLDLFVGGGKEGPQEVTITPMTIKQDYEFTGTIVNTYPNYTTITFRTPGSDTGNSPLSQYPYYNEVLGIFNLLQTPKYKRTTINNGGFNRTAVFDLSNDIEYVLNPAAKLDIQEIKVYLLIMDQDTEIKTFEISPNSPSFSIPFSHGRPTPQLKKLMVVLNLKRQDTNSNTQNVLLSYQYPVQIVSTIVKPSAKIKPATNVDAFCNSSTYLNSARFASSLSGYQSAVKALEQKEWTEARTQERALPENAASFSVYPNPGSTFLTIDYTVSAPASVQILIRNSMGEKFMLDAERNVAAGSYSKDVDVSSLPEGIYYVAIIINGREQVQKVIIRK